MPEAKMHVTVKKWRARGLLRLATWPGKLAALQSELADRYGFSGWPEGQEFVAGDKAELACMAPGIFLLWQLDDDSGEGLDAALMADKYSAIVAVTDWSHAREIFSLQGPEVEALLRLGVKIDLHPSAFPPGQAQQSRIGQLDAYIWRRAEDHFDVLISSSFVGSFQHWLQHAGMVIAA